MMYCPQVQELITSVLQSVRDGLLPPVPTDSHAFAKTYCVRNAFVWDLDPSVKQEGIRHIDYVSMHFAEKDHLPLDEMRSLIDNETRSSHVSDLRAKALRDEIESEELPWFSPPDTISEALLEEIAEQQLDKFCLRDGTHTPHHKAKFPKNHPAGIGSSGTKEEAFPKTSRKAKTLTKSIAARGFNYLAYPRYAGITRTQNATIDSPKIRLIWFAPFLLLLLGLETFGFVGERWLEHKLHMPTLYGTTLSEATDHVASVFSTCAVRSVVFMNGDYPSFDTGKKLDTITHGLKFTKGVQPWEFRYIAKLMLKSHKVLSQPDHQQKFITLLIMIFLHSACYKRIQIGHDLFHVVGMMASGDPYTYIVDTLLSDLRDSICMRLLSWTRLPRLFGGDDSLLAFLSTEFDQIKLMELMAQLFRTFLQPPPKCIVSTSLDDVKFHGRQWIAKGWKRNLHLIYSLLFFRERASLALFPEPFRMSGRADAAIALGRCLSLYQDSGYRYPFLLRCASSISEAFPGVQPRSDGKPEFYEFNDLFAVF
jgi:hypothetical protein